MKHAGEGRIGDSNMHAGLKKNTNPGDSGIRPGSGRVDQNATRDSVAKSHSLGGRTA